MKQYIYVKRKTVRRIVALTVFLIVAVVATVTILPMLLRKPVAQVETLSRNILMADGREVAYFRSVNADSVLTGLALHKDSVNVASPVHLTREELKTVLVKTITHLAQRINYLKEARKEMGYYIGTHNVQDEGYDMVVAHDIELRAGIESTQRLMDSLRVVAESNKYNIIRTSVRMWETLVNPSSVVMECLGGRWAYGRWTKAKHNGGGVTINAKGRTVCAVWKADTITYGWRIDSLGIYRGQMNRWAMAVGHGCYQSNDGTFYEGHWVEDKRDGFGFAVNSQKLRAGEWRTDKFRGERMQYTSERIYGIDISKYQHGKGRKYYPIQWNRLRISYLGKVGSRNVSGTVDYPVSFVYIKSTEGTTVRNRYFVSDYRQARRYGFRTGAYHFFSVRSSVAAQANYFLRHSVIRHGDMPPVLDVEPTDAQINKIGGATVLFSHIRTWMNIVHKRTGVRPVLYVSQRFVNKYLSQAPDIKRNYNVWIARYGEYKPDVKLIYWQLCQDGRVAGIHGDVDINVFNGYRDKFNEFITTEAVK